MKRTLFSITICLALFFSQLALPQKSASAPVFPPFNLLLESDADATGGSEVAIDSYNSLADLLVDNLATSQFSTLDVDATFSVAGITSDGVQIHVLFEADADVVAGNEIAISSFDSFADLLAGNVASTSFSTIDVDADVSVRGFTFDGAQFHLLTETDADASAGNEIGIVSFNSLADILTGNDASDDTSTIDVDADVSVGGFAFDGAQFHLLIELDTDAGGGPDIAITSYDSIPDFLIDDEAFSDTSTIDVESAFSVRGFIPIEGFPTADAGPVQLELDIKSVYVKLQSRRPNRDRFSVRGKLFFSPDSNGFDLSTEDVVVVFGDFTQTIIADSFVGGTRKLSFRGRSGGIKKMLIRTAIDHQNFSISGTGLNLGGNDFSSPIPFSIIIGDDIGETTIQLNSKLKFKK